MDLLLTHGYYVGLDRKEQSVMRPYAPLGLLYLSSHLKAKGFDVEVFDTTFSGPEQFRSFILEKRPTVVGIYANLMTRTEVVRQMETCKEFGATVVVGGPEPANYSAEYLANGADIVVFGEGELTLEELLPHLAKAGLSGMDHIRGIAFMGAKQDVVRTEPRPFIAKLDEQPYPDRAAIDLDAYLTAWRDHHGMGSISLITSRGCPYTCTWCSHAVYGYTHRQRSPENVANEVKLILDQYDPDFLWYSDDVFTIKPSWVQGYAAELKRRGIRIPFETISREDRLDDEMISLLAEMGCSRLWLGSESGSQRVLDAMERRTNVERVRHVTRQLSREGIETGMFIMLGYEGEEIQDLEETVAHLKAAAPDQFLTTLAYPIKGTPYHAAVADRIVIDRVWRDGSDRDFGVAGRRSNRFYRHADRWIRNEVELHRQLRNGRRSYSRLLRSYLGSRAGRLGMLVSANERVAARSDTR